MYGLHHFESDATSIGEIDSPFSRASLLVLFAALLFHVIVITILRIKRREPWWGCVPWGWLIVLPGWLALAFYEYTQNGYVNLLSGILTLVAIVQGVVTAIRPPKGRASVNKISDPTEPAEINAPLPHNTVTRLVLGIVAPLLVCAGSAVNLSSYAFYLPASYPQPVRDQLRMVGRIIESQPHLGSMDKPLRELSEVRCSLTSGGQELIPDSIRERGEFQGYKYTLKRDPRTSGAVLIDAVPQPYRNGMPSLHGFAESSNSSDPPCLIYCITLADHQGAPATKSDPHFHKRPIINWR